MEGNYARTLKTLAYIRSHSVNKFPDYFFVRPNGRCIVKAKMISSLPPQLSKYDQQDEFYLHFDAENKLIMYYAFNIKDYTSGEVENEELGTFDWEKLETQFLHFLIMHLSDFCSSANPYSDMTNDKQETTTTTQTSTTKPVVSSSNDDDDGMEAYNYAGVSTGYGPYNAYGYRAPGPYTNYSSYNDNYKERSAVTDKIENYAKEFRTSEAVDFIYSSMGELIRDKKFDLIDSILKFTWVDKYNSTIFTAMIDSTKDCEKQTGREEFIGKYKTYLAKTKMKPANVELMLKRANLGEKPDKTA